MRVCVNSVHVLLLCTEGFITGRIGMQLKLCVGVYVRCLESGLCHLKLCDVVFVTELKGGKQSHLLKLAAKYTGIEVK